MHAVKSNHSRVERLFAVLPGESQQKVRPSVRTAIRILVCAMLLQFGNMANAQQPPSSGAQSNPIQVVSIAQFDQMLQDGQLMPVTPFVLVIQALQALAAEFKNKAVVDQFMLQNPNLPGFSQLVAATPTNPNVYFTLDGNYRTAITNNNGVSQTIETMGPGTKFASLADSIQSASDPVKQLALYQSAYSQYTALYNQLCANSPPVSSSVLPGNASPADCANLIAPSALADPSELQNASLDSLRASRILLGSLGSTILHIVPLPLSGPVPCDEEVGASTAPGVNSFSDSLGDQTQSTGFKLNPSGIVANFNYPNKNLISCIKNQGSRGTCHIFAATSAVEELVARDTGVMVNLSEQDFMEHLKLLWDPSYFNDNGGSGSDLQTAAGKGYKFVYENQWDYNASLNQPLPPAYEYVKSCFGYPYPSLEPGCSATAPQAPETCIKDPRTGVYGRCGFSSVVLSPRTSYSAIGAGNFWDPAHKDQSINDIYLYLGLNDAVVMDFNLTNNFVNVSSLGYVAYSSADNMTSNGSHSVHIVGYISNSDLESKMSVPTGSGGGYFIIKNSYGAWFGDDGYVYLPVDWVKANAYAMYVVPGLNY